MTATLGSLFAGYGGLDMACEQALGVVTRWHVELDPDAAKVLAARWPLVPNLGDVTAVDWSQVEPVDVLCGGFPCQDVSSAGKREGLRDGTRSGLWASFAEAIGVLRPSLVIVENVRGLLSACAHSDLEPCPRCVGGAGAHRPVLRALGRVLGDLADLGFDAEWRCVRASDVGAPHRRERVFVAAWPADAAHIRRERLGSARGGRTGSADGGGAAADAAGCNRSNVACLIDEGRPMVGASPSASDRVGERRPAERVHGLERSAGVAWGPYAAAVARWEAILGRPAPSPTDDLGRLNPPFVEWLMGLPEGWVTDPALALTRPAMLRLLGNGVVPAQAAHAIQLLLATASEVAA